MAGILYGVGVGPGDPELMTIKAVRIIREHAVFALPGKVPQETTAYQIAVQAVPELAEKELVPIYMPMVMDREEQKKNHREGAKLIESYLAKGQDVVFLTLGDPTIYSTFSYIQHIVEADGYEIVLVSGIPSFCAAAAALKTPLSEWTEPLHVIPAVHRLDTVPDQPGNYVLMKSGSKMGEVKELLRRFGKKVCMAENCSMPGEKLYHSVDEIPDNAGYFSLIIAKEQDENC